MPLPAMDAPTLETAKGTPYLQKPGVVLLAMPATDIRGMKSFLSGYATDLGLSAYLDDPVRCRPRSISARRPARSAMPASVRTGPGTGMMRR